MLPNCEFCSLLLLEDVDLKSGEAGTDPVSKTQEIRILVNFMFWELFSTYQRSTFYVLLSNKAKFASKFLEMENYRLVSVCWVVFWCVVKTGLEYSLEEPGAAEHGNIISSHEF